MTTEISSSIPDCRKNSSCNSVVHHLIHGAEHQKLP
ncbi:unnamed protein product [Musa acuminata var. zebrina]